MRFPCLITRATDTPSQCVIRTAFPRQQWLCERAWMLRYTYRLLVVHCIVIVNAKKPSEVKVEICYGCGWLQRGNSCLHFDPSVFYVTRAYQFFFAAHPVVYILHYRAKRYVCWPGKESRRIVFVSGDGQTCSKLAVNPSLTRCLRLGLPGHIAVHNTWSSLQ